MSENKYAQDGVDVPEGDFFSQFAGNLCQQTYGNSFLVEVMNFSRSYFRGPRGFRPVGLPEDCWLDLAPDGDGTKVVLVDAAGDYEHAAYGWVAMTCGDITRWGGIPLVLVNNLDVNSLGKTGDSRNKAFRAMMMSLKRIADEQSLIMFKGETAELGNCVGTDNPQALAKYLWSGVALGAYNPKTIITGDKVQEGMAIMALREDGFRNNGISSVRKAILMAFGPNGYSNPDAQEAIRQAAAPAVLYDKFLATANGWYHPRFQPKIPMFLIVHVTGGAIKSKLAEDILFPRGLSAVLDDLWEPAPIVKQCAEWRGMSDKECYEFWGCGQGALVVIWENDIDKFIHLASNHGIDAKLAGKITKKASPRVTIISKFNGDVIEFAA